MNRPTVITPQRWQRLQEIFDRAVTLDPAHRPAFLESECGADEVLREQVLALLEASDDDGRDLEQRLEEAIAGTLQEAEVSSGERIGHYRVLRLLGRGGMGAVYLAERADDQFQQLVAIKIVARGFVHGAIAGRFRSERQILARLNHANIARLLDGGRTADGAPYLVMEYVEGLRIDQYCDERRLGTRERLQLVRQVCAAVQYAHQNLIVHRDIKPSNILVAAEGMPKLLDFGIAKLLDPDSAGLTVAVTQFRDRVLTPEHASPEQIRGEPVGTVSDVYALGVLLYELLTGSHPHRVPGQSSRDLERRICETDPPAPSARVRAAAREGMVPRHPALARELRGDLDRIVLKAMHREPQRRYASAAALADDIQNYLEGRPVEARPDGWTYRAGKFVRRNALAVGATLGALLLVAGLTVYYTLGLAAARDRAELEAAKSRQVADFLAGIFRVADPSQSQGREITALELLDQGARDVESRLADQPVILSDLLFAIGNSYKSLAAYERAGPLIERSLALKEAAGLTDTREYARALYELANLRRFEGRFAEAEEAFRRTLDIQRRIFPGPDGDTAATLTHLAVLYYEMHRWDASYALQRQALEMTLALHGERHAASADRMNNLALVLRELGRYAEAERYFRQAIAVQAEVLGERHPDALVTRYNLGLILAATGRFAEAERQLRELLPVRREVLGAQHPSVAFTASALGSVLTSLGRFDEAERLLREAHEVLAGRLGERHWRTASVLRNLGQLALARGDSRGAEARFRRVASIEAATFGAESAAVHRTNTLIAATLLRRERRDEARSILERSYAALHAAEERDQLDLTRTLLELARLRVEEERWDEASALYRRVLGIFERPGLGAHPDAAEGWLGLAEVALRQGRAGEAAEASQSALALLTRTLPEDHWRIALARVTLGRSLLLAGRRDEAAPLIQRGSEALAALLPATDPRVLAARAAQRELENASR